MAEESWLEREDSKKERKGQKPSSEDQLRAFLTIVLESQGVTARGFSSFADYVEIERMKLAMVPEA